MKNFYDYLEAASKLKTIDDLEDLHRKRELNDAKSKASKTSLKRLKDEIEANMEVDLETLKSFPEFRTIAAEAGIAVKVIKNEKQAIDLIKNATNEKELKGILASLEEYATR